MKDAIKKNTAWNLLQVATFARVQAQHIADDYDLTSTQLYALCSLDPTRPISMRNISLVLECDASNVTGLVDRLLHHGYVERHELPDDRRVKVVSLTDKGIALRAEALQRLAEAPLDGLQYLSPGERVLLDELLVKMLTK
ncbi:MAG TPA: MarR family transcriptional regulator [Verrucomicrobiae bacterium]|nr:MarR family transcriptional regulator [Verrucomicrobiae bacterium]